MRTCWEQIGNKEEKQKIPPPHYTPPPKGKNRAHHECMMSLLIGCMKFLCSKNCLSPFLAWANERGRNLGKTGDTYFCFILISWGCLTSPTFFLFAMSQFDWPITKNNNNKKIKIETMEAPQIRRFYGKIECLPL